ncbi:L-dopachrome tautomerase-related protein [Curvibacter sp. APW13]|uniref:SMP-30/gluconolactonase/LRE family protein n=1 Tax=Curvibacter sp. APW13 TaxID=3077236 RepID=UPI0028DFFFCF|nr:L-dopachrome tautomerase-related protein [Curvibacter sp. APW13]MDT8990784.1 L-dopachrome tautomerase-related protein [Curvibacter sp. APW13]
MKTWTLRIGAVLAIALALGMLWLKLVHGGGSAYPSVATPALTPASSLQTVATLDFPPGNVAVAADGRTFMNYHPFAKAERFGPTMFEVVNGKPVPWPSLEAQKDWQGVFGMTVDRQNRLWLIEPAGLDHARTRLTAWSLASNAKVYEHWFDKGVLPFAQDLRITADGRRVILADTGLFKFTRPAIAVFEPESGRLLLRLEQHPSTQAQDWTIRTPLGPHKLGYGLVNFAVGVDGIALSDDDQWLYFGGMSHQHLYRVPLAALSNPEFDEAALGQLVEDQGVKPLSDGITIDSRGRVILTDIEHGGLVRRRDDGQLETLVSDPQVVWADGVVQAPDGALLFTDSAIPAYIDQFARPPSLERLVAHRPYRLLRLPAISIQ